MTAIMPWTSPKTFKNKMLVKNPVDQQGPDWKEAPTQSRANRSYLYTREEIELLRDINLSLIIIKMAYNLGENRGLVENYICRNLQAFVLLNMEYPRKEYLTKLTVVARQESSQMVYQAGYNSFDDLGRRWQRSGKDLYDEQMSIGPLGDQFESKLQHILKKYALLAKAPYLITMTRLPEEPTRIEVPRFYVERPFIHGGLVCASFEEAITLAKALAPAAARDDKDEIIEHFTCQSPK